MCELIDASRQICALDAYLAATKQLLDRHAQSGRRARLTLIAAARQSAQWTASAAAPADARNRASLAAQREAVHAGQLRDGDRAAAAAAAAERVTPVTPPKSSPSVGRSSSFEFGVSTQVRNRPA